MSDALPARKVAGTTADIMKFDPARFVEPGMPPAAMLAAGTDRTVFSGVWSEAARVAAGRHASVNKNRARASRVFMVVQQNQAGFGLRAGEQDSWDVSFGC